MQLKPSHRLDGAGVLSCRSFFSLKSCVPCLPRPSRGLSRPCLSRPLTAPTILIWPVGSPHLLPLLSSSSSILPSTPPREGSGLSSYVQGALDWAMLSPGLCLFLPPHWFQLGGSRKLPPPAGDDPRHSGRREHAPCHPRPPPPGRGPTCTEEREARALLRVRLRSQRWMESCTSTLSCRVTVILS